MSNLTSVELRKQIRKIAGLRFNKNIWFTRQEMKAITRKLNGAANWITDDPDKKTYKRTEDLFPAYLNFWVEQATVNTHPSRINLVKIYEALTNKNKPLAADRILVDKKSFSIDEEISNVFSHIPESLLSRAKEVVIQKDSINVSIRL